MRHETIAERRACEHRHAGYREIQGDTGRYREMQGDTGRYREI
jgi:hypothetical protein